MKDIETVIRCLYEVGVTQEKTIEIMNEIVDNGVIYAGQPDNIDAMLQEKLTIDQYISLKSYFIL